MEGESGITRNIVDEFDSWDIQRDQIQGEKGLIRSINDEFHSSDMQRD